MVGYAAADTNAYGLGESIIKLMSQNGVTNSYFDNKAYMKEDTPRSGIQRTVKKAAEVWYESVKRTHKTDRINILFYRFLV